MKLVFIFLLLFAESQQFFDIQFDRFELMFQNESFFDYSKLRVRKYNKTVRLLIGEITYNQPIGNEIIVEVKGYKKQGNQYRLLPYHAAPTPYCTSLENDRKDLFDINLKFLKILSITAYMYEDFVKGSDFPKDRKTCPYPAVKWLKYLFVIVFNQILFF